MGAQPILADSARKHGVRDDDMLHAYDQPIRVFDLDEGFTLIIGPSQSAQVSRSASLMATRLQSSSPP